MSSHRGSINEWQCQTGGIDQFLYDWGANRGRDAKIIKADTLQEIIWLDQKEDTSNLSKQEWTRRYLLEDHIIQLYKDEELYWRQRGHQKRLT